MPLCSTVGRFFAKKRCRYGAIDNVFFYKPNKDATNVKAVEADGADAKVIGIFDLGGRKVENMNAKGVYIVKTPQGVRKVMRR